MADVGVIAIRILSKYLLQHNSYFAILVFFLFLL